MEDSFTEEQFDMMIQITQALMANPEQLATLYELVLPPEESSKEAA